MAASEAVVDFTNVQDGGDTFNKKRQREGDYKATIKSVKDAPSKKDNINQWLFTIQVGSGTYPYYCKHQENQYWKIRNLLQAAGMNVPKKRVKVDPNKLVGRNIAVTLEDDEYDGKLQSNIAHTFALADLEDQTVPAEADDAEVDDDEEEAPPARKAKAAPAPVDDDDDEDEEEAPAPKKKKAPVVEEDDDLEEIDIDDT
jgi:hypothetical protein